VLGCGDGYGVIKEQINLHTHTHTHFAKEKKINSGTMREFFSEY
jgi:hypothetical protein